MSYSGIRLENRSPENGTPFRETEWDQRLDKMLDDLKTTVHTDVPSRRDNSLTSSFRSTSRSDSRNSNRGVEDAGLMRHHHKEYTSPDKSTRIVTDEYEYDSGDPNKAGQYQKKVKKSTYSSYKVQGGISDELDALRHGPSQSIMAESTPDPKVVTASQRVANKLVHALSTIGGSKNQQVNNSTLDSNSDYSTLTRLDKDIIDLNYILRKLEEEEELKRPAKIRNLLSENEYVLSQNQINSRKTLQNHGIIDQVNPIPANPTTKITNGYDDMEGVEDGKGGEVRRIVWRNRFEKTCESQDSSTPKLSVEEDAWKQRMKKHEITTKTSSTRTTIPQISPAGQPWTEPIPLPTPPQLSPGEPGVAYVYTYGQDGGSQLQTLPPLNYQAGAPNSAGGPTPQVDANGKPIVYHYSYHYSLPDQKTPGDSQNYHMPVSSQPALEVAPSPRHHTHTDKVVHSNPVHSSSYQSSHTSYTNRSEHTKEDNYNSSINRVATPNKFPNDFDNGSPVFPRKGGPGNPDEHNNLSIRINKVTTHTTHTKEYGGGPTTSTPISERYGKPAPITTTTSYQQHPPGNDSLERLKKPYQESKAFPDTSPINPTSDVYIPRHVDDLMTTFDSEGNITRIGYQPSMSNGPRQPVEHEPLIVNKKPERREEIEIIENGADWKKEETTNLNGPPVYYPPGHQQLFDESMHTMSLKENKRQGMAKWRREAAMKESASSKSSKGGDVAMVPVCLPLCCGAACVLM